MDITSHFHITDIRHSEEKRLEIGDQVYLISKHGVSVRKEIIFEKEFTRVPMDKSSGVAQHLSFEGSFNIHGKLLDISAQSKTTFGPLGDRLSLYAYYDNNVIGNYRALRSYMGGGIDGKWPFLKTKEWSIIFTLNSTGFHNKNNILRIEYFKTIIYDPYIINEDEKRKYLIGKNLSEEFLKTRFDITELEKQKNIEWLVPIKDDTFIDKIYKISCCSYSEYELYCKVYYGNLLKINESMADREFIGKAVNDTKLHTLEIEIKNNSKRYFPWNKTEIFYNV